MNRPERNRKTEEVIMWAGLILLIAACCVVVHRQGGQANERRMHECVK